MTPSQPSRHASSHGRSCSTSSTRCIGSLKGRLRQECLTLLERQTGHVAAIEPENVEHVVGAAAVPGRLAVEDDVVDGQSRKDADEIGEDLAEDDCVKQLDVIAVLVREQTDAIELTLEQPVAAVEALFGQRRGHWLQPVGQPRRTAHSIPGNHFTALP